MCSDWSPLHVVEPGAIAWNRVEFIEVEAVDAGRRLELNEPGPIASIPLPGIDRRYSVNVVHRDDTWDRVLWTGDPVTAFRTAHELGEQHRVEVRT